MKFALFLFGYGTSRKLVSISVSPWEDKETKPCKEHRLRFCSLQRNNSSILLVPLYARYIYVYLCRKKFRRSNCLPETINDMVVDNNVLFLEHTPLVVYTAKMLEDEPDRLQPGDILTATTAEEENQPRVGVVHRLPAHDTEAAYHGLRQGGTVRHTMQQNGVHLL